MNIKKFIGRLGIWNAVIVIALLMIVGSNFKIVYASDITVYKQKDSRWSSHSYGYKDAAGTQKTTIGEAGCGILSYTNAVYYLNDSFIEPKMLADYSVNNGYRVNGSGTAYGLYKNFADKKGDSYGIKYAETVVGYSKLKDYLIKGAVAICSKPGHIMCIVDYKSSNDEYLLLDSFPSSNRGTSKGYAWKTESQLTSIGVRNTFYIIESVQTSVQPYVNLGDNFYAYIINTKSWKHVTPDLSGNNISISSGDADSKVWHFERQGDGSYKITAQDGRCMDVEMGGTEKGTNVSLYEYSGANNQRWYITGESGAYEFRAACSSNVLDVSGDSSEDGTNVQMWERHGGSAQKFSIWGKDAVKSGHACVAAGSTYTPTSIWWDNTNADCYDVKIWKGKVWEGEPYKILEGLRETSCEINLPAGYYEGYVDYKNGYSLAKSENNFSFTISDGQPVDIGDSKYVQILIKKNWHPLSNDNGNVALGYNTGTNEELWKLERQGDGSYVIRSVKDGKVLDVDNGRNADGTNVQVWDYNGGDGQKWYIYGRWNGEYYLKPKCASRVLDVTHGNNNSGDNVALYGLNYSDAQRFEFWGYPVPGKSELTCSPGTSYSKTSFEWSATSDTKDYNLRIYKGKCQEGENVKSLWGLTGTKCSVSLPAGEYEAYIDSSCDYTCTKSNVVKFTVREDTASTPVNLGTGFLAKIYTTDSRSPIGYENGRINGHVQESDALSQVWRFERQSDGSYVIYSAEGKGVITAQAQGDTPVQVAGYSGSELQKWFIYGNSTDGYTVKSSGNGCVFDVLGGDNAAKGSLGTFRLQYSSNQLFDIEKTGDVVIGTSAVTVEEVPEQEAGNVRIYWTEAQNATSYDILIYDEAGTKIKQRIQDLEGAPYLMKLAVGKYQVRVQAKNAATGGKKNSAAVSLTAKESLAFHTMELDKTTYRYDGTAKKPRVTLRDSRGQILSQSSYTVSYENNINAGSVTVKAEGRGYYTGIRTEQFSIEKIPQVVGLQSGNLTVDDTETVLLDITGFGQLSFSSDLPDVAEVDAKGQLIAKKAGSVKITVTAAGDTNHDPATGVFDIRVIHHYDKGKVTKAATCEEAGVKTFTCEGCGDSYTESIPALGHIWSTGETVKETTCQEPGEIQFRCTACGKTETEQVESVGHVGESELRGSKEATCTEDGYSGDIYCKACGQVVESGNIIPKTGHKWDAGVITKASTCAETGIKTYTCTIDGTTMQEELPALGHAGITEVKNVKQATCKEPGYTGDVCCGICGAVLQEGSVTGVLPHTWDAGTTLYPAEVGKKGVIVYSCTVCQEEKIETTAALPAQPESEPKPEPEPQKPSAEETGNQNWYAGLVIKDKKSGGVYRVNKDLETVTYVKPVNAKTSKAAIPKSIQAENHVCKVTGIGKKAFQSNKSLVSVTIGDFVQSIEANAFYGCKKLTKVSGGKRVAAIGDNAFYGCIILKSISLSSVLHTIGKKAFGKCTALTKITLPGNVKMVKAQAFYGCKSLKSIIIKTKHLGKKQVGSKVFSGTAKRIVVKVPKKQLNAYKKLLRGSGISAKAVYKKY